ncbi:unnamed protein product [Pseudo-nitzschia multistriata]|uniref:DUF1990 domain-containing protein n=1 Tax=Pseudo-nitzschia multistriata TaxID=183589 RepID=A0A448ZS47_9STRA|nr:unnamed protein product [Pseudo-nitzschia multistriata]
MPTEMRGPRIRWCVAILVVAAIWACDAKPMFGRRRAVPPLKRKMQSWFIRNRSQSKMSDTMYQRTKNSVANRHNNNSCRPKQRGSFMTSTRPTKEQLYRWFGIEGENPNQFLRCMMLRNTFNHNISGITNPFLKVQRSCEPQRTRDCDSIDSSSPLVDNNGKRTLKNIAKVVEKSQRGEGKSGDKNFLKARRNTVRANLALESSSDVENSWWPSLQISQNDDPDRGPLKEEKKSFRKQDWRILTYRKRVGRGKDCYEKVRDAALDWEFQSADGSMGMMQVPEACPSGDKFAMQTSHAVSTKSKGSYSVRPVEDDSSGQVDNRRTHSSSSYRSLGSRRLVSFASKSLTEILPSPFQRRLYSINPVMVVYDVVDQRAPDGQSTFTSTAYSTLKGHFIKGEERVTVALRDGSQDVEVEILSISRAGSGIAGKTLWPFIGKMQSKFFQQQLQHLSDCGNVVDTAKY